MSFISTYDIDESVFAFSTRRLGGGVSQGAYGEMNINPYCGDSLEHVDANTIILSEKLGIDRNNIILPHQVHNTEIRAINSDFFSSTDCDRKRFLEGVDAVMTDLKGICIGVSTADCVPVLLYDKKKSVVAAIHAGWRGTVENIVKKSLQAMHDRYGCNYNDIKAIIGPSISKEAFEVGDEVYDKFATKGFDMKRISCIIDNRWHIDLWEANRMQMMELGVPEERIIVSGVCTYFNYEEFFSARRLSVNSGRIYSGIMLKK